MRLSVVSISSILFSLVISFSANAAMDFDGVAEAGRRMVRSSSWSGYAPEADRQKYQAALEKYSAALSDGKTPKFEALAEYEKSLKELETASKAHTWKRSYYGTVSDNLSKVNRARKDLAKQGIVDEKQVAQSAKEDPKSESSQVKDNKPVTHSGFNSTLENTDTRPVTQTAQTQNTANSQVAATDAKATDSETSKKPAVAADSPAQASSGVSAACAENWRKCTDEDRAKQAKKGMEKATARCFYAGFQGFDKGGKCKPASDDPELAKKQAGAFADKLKCKGGGLLPCNPVVFGLGANGKAICVPRSKDATKKCESSSLIAKADCSEEKAASSKTKKACADIAKAKKEYAEIMKANPETIAELRALDRSLTATCGKDEADSTVIGLMSQEAGIANANRQNWADYHATCSELKKQIARNQDELLWPKSQIKANAVSSPANSEDAGIK